MHKKINLILCSVLILVSSQVSAAPDVAKGKLNYDKLCLSCHGASGAGDGPVGISLPVPMRPASLQAAQYKFAKDLAKFKELLQKGGAAVGLNALMPAQSGLSEADVEDLYAFVQSLKK